MEKAKPKRLNVFKNSSALICLDFFLGAIVAGVALSTGFEETRECAPGMWLFVILNIAYFAFFVVRNSIILCIAYNSVKPE